MFKFHEIENTVIAELTDENFVISDVQDVVDLLGNVTFSDCSRLIISENNLSPDFFRLKTGLAVRSCRNSQTTELNWRL